MRSIRNKRKRGEAISFSGSLCKVSSSWYVPQQKVSVSLLEAYLPYSRFSLPFCWSVEVPTSHLALFCRFSIILSILLWTTSFLINPSQFILIWICHLFSKWNLTHKSLLLILSPYTLWRSQNQGCKVSPPATSGPQMCFFWPTQY